MRIGAELLTRAGRRVSPLGSTNMPAGVSPSAGVKLAHVLPVAGLGPGLGESTSGATAPVPPGAVLTSPAALSQYGLRLYVESAVGEIIVGGAVRVFALYSE